MLHAVLVRTLHTSQRVQLSLGDFALGDELLGVGASQVITRRDVVVDAEKGLLEAGGGEDVGEEEVAEEEVRAVVWEGKDRVVGRQAELGEEGSPGSRVSLLSLECRR
jgi:hypothetical protein